jgi:quercetin dioxygenase-like cupin family protein
LSFVYVTGQLYEKEDTMKIVRASDRGTHYDPPNHWGCWPMRIHGKEETGVKGFSVAISEYLPDGGTKDEGMPAERVLYVLSGTMKVKSGNEEYILGTGDSVFRPAGEPGEIWNVGNNPCVILVVIAPVKQ